MLIFIIIINECFRFHYHQENMFLLQVQVNYVESWYSNMIWIDFSLIYFSSLLWISSTSNESYHIIIGRYNWSFNIRKFHSYRGKFIWIFNPLSGKIKLFFFSSSKNPHNSIRFYKVMLINQHQWFLWMISMTSHQLNQ